MLNMSGCRRKRARLAEGSGAELRGIGAIECLEEAAALDRGLRGAAFPAPLTAELASFGVYRLGCRPAALRFHRARSEPQSRRHVWDCQGPSARMLKLRLVHSTLATKWKLSARRIPGRAHVSCAAWAAACSRGCLRCQ